MLWNVLQQDPAGRVTSAVLGNGLTQTDVYSPTSTRLTGATLLAADGTRRLKEGYGYDKLGNVSSRNQQWNGHGFIETFDYDELNRLKSGAIGSDVKTINYHPDGRIRNKTGVGSGDYAYPTPGAGSVRPNAVTSIAGIGNFQYDDNGNLLSGAGRTISWTAFDMPMTIAKGGASGTFVYGPEHQRARQDRGDGTSVVYADRQETELGAGGSVTLKTYWPLGIGVEIDRPGKATELRWTHTDRLGSPIALSDEAGLVQEELAYDPWGKRRDPVSHATPDTLDGKIDNKGFTNHEMLDQLDLVHMNGRVYDPFVARFLSGDPIIQDPTNGQNYDRYSYVFNNPTNLTDPTGFSAACTGGGTGTLIPICNRTDDDKVINRPGGERDILRGNGKGLTLEKLVARGEKVNSAGTGAPNGKLSSEKSANSEKGMVNRVVDAVEGEIQQQKNYLKFNLQNPLEALENATAPFGAGSAIAGIAAKSGKVSAWIGKLFGKEEALLGGGRAHNAYEVIAEVPISGRTRTAHRAAANRELANGLAKDADYSRIINAELNHNVLQHMQSGRNLLNPAGTVWHHPIGNPNVMQLLRATEHQNPLLQSILHPKNISGKNIGGFGTHYGN